MIIFVRRIIANTLIKERRKVDRKSDEDGAQCRESVYEDTMSGLRGDMR